MAKFCIYCGKAIGEDTKFCPFCGKAAAPQKAPAPETTDTSPVEPAPVQTASPQPQPAPQPAASAAPTIPAAPAAAGKGINWLLIISIIVIAAVLVLAVVLAIRNGNSSKQPQSAMTQEEWPDIPGFTQDDVDTVAYTLLPGCELLSYDSVYYNEEQQSVYLCGCRLKAPEGSLLDLSDATVDMCLNMSDPDAHMCSLYGFDGTFRLKTGNQFTVSDPGGNEIEVWFEAQPYVTSTGYTVQFPNVFIADLTWMDIMRISNPTMSLDMTFDIAGDDSEFPYILYTDDGAYVIYLDELFRPAGYESTYYS